MYDRFLKDLIRLKDDVSLYHRIIEEVHSIREPYRPLLSFLLSSQPERPFYEIQRLQRPLSWPLKLACQCYEDQLPPLILHS